MLTPGNHPRVDDAKMHNTRLRLDNGPSPVTVTTWIIPFLVGNPYKPSFVTVIGWGVDQNFPQYFHISQLRRVAQLAEGAAGPVCSVLHVPESFLLSFNVMFYLFCVVEIESI